MEYTNPQYFKCIGYINGREYTNCGWIELCNHFGERHRVIFNDNDIFSQKINDATKNIQNVYYDSILEFYIKADHIGHVIQPKFSSAVLNIKDEKDKSKIIYNWEIDRVHLRNDLTKSNFHCARFLTVSEIKKNDFTMKVYHENS